MKDLAAEIVGAITAFDKKCTETQGTDVGDVWTLLGYIKERLGEFAGDRLTREQVEDLAGSIQGHLTDPGFLRDVCLAYARTFSRKDYNGWFGIEEEIA